MPAVKTSDFLAASSPYGMLELYRRQAAPAATSPGGSAAYENQALRNRYLAYVST